MPNEDITPTKCRGLLVVPNGVTWKVLLRNPDVSPRCSTSFGKFDSDDTSGFNSSRRNVGTH
jgi:hypothetical protein